MNFTSSTQFCLYRPQLMAFCGKQDYYKCITEFSRLMKWNMKKFIPRCVRFEELLSRCIKESKSILRYHSNKKTEFMITLVKSGKQYYEDSTDSKKLGSILFFLNADTPEKGYRKMILDNLYKEKYDELTVHEAILMKYIKLSNEIPYQYSDTVSIILNGEKKNIWCVNSKIGLKYNL